MDRVGDVFLLVADWSDDDVRGTGHRIWRPGFFGNVSEMGGSQSKLPNFPTDTRPNWPQPRVLCHRFGPRPNPRNDQSAALCSGSEPFQNDVQDHAVKRVVKEGKDVVWRILGSRSVGVDNLAC